MALNPIGPLPSSTYWRRRLVLLVGVVALVLVARSCVGGGKVAPGRATTRLTTPSPSPTRSASPQPTLTSPTPSPTHLAQVAGDTCADASLALTAASDVSDYKIGTTPRFTLTIKNVSSVSCQRDLGTAAVELVVYSGNDRIWSSLDCGGARTASVQTVRSGASLESTTLWNQKRSAPGCTGTATQAQPGTYRLVSHVGSLQSADVVFHLHT